MHIVVPARPAQLASLRAELRAWLRQVEETSAEAELAVLIAVNEAASNVIEHAYRGQPQGVIDVELTATDDAIRVEVVDHGRWRPPAADPGSRGRGLLLMQGCTDISLSRGTDGTRVVLRVPRAA